VGEDMVSDHTAGFGGGGSSRNRAAQDFETELMDTEESLKLDTKALKDAKSKKAKARWHFALEKVTTGQMSNDDSPRLNPSFLLLWKLRSATIASCALGHGDTENMPSLLMRGWRPSAAFITNLLQQRPEFAWAHPMSYQVDDVPSSVSSDEVENSILTVLQSEEEFETSASNDGRVNVVSSLSTGETWKAVLQFLNEDDYKLFQKKASLSDGIALVSKNVTPQVQAAIETTKSILDGAQNEYEVSNMNM